MPTNPDQVYWDEARAIVDDNVCENDQHQDIVPDRDALIADIASALAARGGVREGHVEDAIHIPRPQYIAQKVVYVDECSLDQFKRGSAINIFNGSVRAKTPGHRPIVLILAEMPPTPTEAALIPHP